VIKRPERETDFSSISSIEIKNAGRSGLTVLLRKFCVAQSFSFHLLMFPLNEKGLHIETMKYLDISDSFLVELRYLGKRATNQQIRIILTMKLWVDKIRGMLANIQFCLLVS
jgi:hypothetical protein